MDGAEDRAGLAKRWFDCAMACLYRANFLQNHRYAFGTCEHSFAQLNLFAASLQCRRSRSLSCLAKIPRSSLARVRSSKLTSSQRRSSTILPTLLTTGISIAQDLVLHRMISDLDWETSMQGQPHEVRVKSLIGREMRKRIFWALVRPPYVEERRRGG